MPTPVGDLSPVIVSVDYGTTNPSVFLQMARHTPTGRIHVCREMYHDSAVSGQLTDGQLADKMEAFLPKEYLYVVVDPSATSFIVELKSRGIRVKEADNAVIDGIQAVSGLLHTDMLGVDPSCHHLIREFGAYVWDSKAQNRGEDKPVKAHDHCEDCLRYGTMELRQLNRKEVSSPGGSQKSAPIPGHTRGSGRSSGGRFAGW